MTAWGGGPSLAHSTSYRPDVDGLRALAVIPVLLFHAKLGFPGGFVGVDIFFVISGFLISSLILKDLGEGTFSLVKFWERRIRRILPVLVVVVLASLVAGCFLFLPDDLEALGKSLVAQAALLSNVFFYRQGLDAGGYFASVTQAKTLLHTWSLAVEEQFYLVFPLLLVFLAGCKTVSVTKTVAALAIGSFVWSAFGSHVYPQATFYLLPSRAWELLLGGLLAMSRGKLFVSQRVSETGGWIGVGLILFSIFFYDENTRFPGLAAFPPCFGTALIIYSSDSRRSVVGTMLALGPIVFIGLISYSLYLWHWPLLVFSRYYFEHRDIVSHDFGAGLRASVLLISILLAILSWKFIETPFRKKQICRKRSWVYALGGVSLVTMCILGASILYSRGLPARFHGRASIYLSSYNHRDFLNEVTLEKAVAGQFFEIGSHDTNQVINLLIWGDSHAMSVTPVLDELCRRFSWRGVQATHSATAPILGYVSQDKFGLGEKAPVFENAVAAFIVQNHVKNVLLAGAWSGYLDSDRSKTQLLATVRTLLNSGAHVYVLKDVPYQDHDIKRIIRAAALHDYSLEQIGVTPADYQQKNREAETVFRELSGMGADILDPTDCFRTGNGIYGIVKNNQILYCDYHHLTVEGARILTDVFEPIFHTKMILGRHGIAARP